ncbi:MAG: hypothetical protein ACO4BJ_09310, partial [Planctomycetota bacterium]
FSIVLSFDGLELDVRAVEVGADLLGLNEGAGPDFWGPQILTDIVTVGVLFQLIPAPDGSWDQAITASDSLNPPEILVLRCAGAPGALDGNAGGLVTTSSSGMRAAAPWSRTRWCWTARPGSCPREIRSR